jgi:hypothetical protein
MAQAPTTMIQEIRASDTARYFGPDADFGTERASVTPGASPAAVLAEAADHALAYLTEMSIDLRGAAILDGSGTVLASTGDDCAWASGAERLLAAADSCEDEPVSQTHIATEQGEVFAVRAEGLTAVAVTERFTLASLMAFDLRAVLRDLARGGDGEPG